MSQDPGNIIVAQGIVINSLHMQDMVIHNIPLLVGHMKVTITDPEVPDAALPVQQKKHVLYLMLRVHMLNAQNI